MPRTTIDLTRDNYSRLRSYSQRRHMPLKRAVNTLLSRALGQSDRPATPAELPRLPQFDVGVKVDPADRDALYAAMEQRP